MTKVFNRDVEVAGTLKDNEGAVFIPQIAANGTVSAQAATATLTTDIAGKIITNTGASGAVVYTLPSASSMKGKTFKVKVLVAQQVSLSPIATDAIYLAGSGAVNKDVVLAGAIGNEVSVYSDGTYYHAYFPNGVVTKEA